MMMKIRIAICQSDIVWEQTGVNLARLEKTVADADAEIVVLPEMFATGFKLMPARVDEPMDGLIVRTMHRWASDYGKAVVGSVVISEGDCYYNRMLFVEPSGKMTIYDKRHPFSPGGEGKFYRRGDRRVVVEYGGFRFLLLVCYDLRFPVWSRCRGDYDAIVYVASWDSVRRAAWCTLLRARAIENQCYVIGVNRVGDDPEDHYVGDSAVIDYLGRDLVNAGDRECCLVATLDLEELRGFREKFPTWRDADDFELKV